MLRSGGTAQPFRAVAMDRVKSSDGLTEADVFDHCQGRLARFKQPKAVQFIDEIPRNPSGKVLQFLLRERFPGPAPV